MKNKHLSFNDRLEIEKWLTNNLSFKKLQVILKKTVLLYLKKLKTLSFLKILVLLENHFLTVFIDTIVHIK